ncbi:MAG TPA: cyclase family protein [Clostridiaceae bacterium]|nr:cyclase family protein [Clostridiaceae bacterium]
MKIYDISMSIHSGMPVYKNSAEKIPVLKVTRDFTSGNVFESKITLDMHTGTHLDAPLHVIEDGKTVESIDLFKVITKCKVIDMTHIATKITRADLEPVNINSGDFVLFKTRNSYTDKFEDNFVYLDESGAQYLREKGIKGVGIDSLGIERNQPGHPTHKLLLGSDIVILEGLRLAEIDEGEYFLIAMPLKIDRAEACPVRAILLEELP